jgi:hypothetical protein
MVRALILKVVPKAVLPTLEAASPLTLRQLPSNQQARSPLRRAWAASSRRAPRRSAASQRTAGLLRQQAATPTLPALQPRGAVQDGDNR